MINNDDEKLADGIEDTMDSILKAVGMDDGGFCSYERATIIQVALLRVLAYMIAHQPQRDVLLDMVCNGLRGRVAEIVSGQESQRH